MLRLLTCLLYINNRQLTTLIIYESMEKVVILARVSTDKQEYERQINELT